VGRQWGSELVSGEEGMETGDGQMARSCRTAGGVMVDEGVRGRAGLEAGGVLSPLLEIAEMFNLIINENCTKYID
jgi:hypothetical protein